MRTTVSILLPVNIRPAEYNLRSTRQVTLVSGHIVWCRETIQAEYHSHSAYDVYLWDRRSDRRGVTPSHILYMAMKILRIRVRGGIFNASRCVRQTERVTREMIEDIEFVHEMIDTNLAFMKSIPNSVQYWSNRKKDFVLTETWLRDPASIDMADFSHIVSKCYERNEGRGGGVAVYISRVNLMNHLVLRPLLAYCTSPRW
jgi:hypothetical protein